MSDVSKFKILDKVVKIKDTEGRAEAIARYNQLLDKINNKISNYTFDDASISSPSGGQWYTPVHFTTEHTCYALINFQVIIPANFSGTFNIRIIDTSANTTLGFDTIETSHASTITHTGGNLTIFVKILSGHTISGELFFVYSDKAVQNVDAQIMMIELATAL